MDCRWRFVESKLDLTVIGGRTGKEERKEEGRRFRFGERRKKAQMR